MTVDATAKSKAPDWYLPDAAVDYERACLPEWFDGSAPHRTVASYLQARMQMMKMSDDLGTKYVTATLVRRSIPGDAGSLLRLHEFLTAHSLMNEEATNDSAPTATALLGTDTSPLYWTERQDERLVQVLVQASKERTAPGQAMDWEAMAEQVGSGKTAAECEQRFLALPLETALPPPAGSITPDTTMSEVETSTTSSSALTAVQDLVADCLPAVRHKIVETALEETSSLSQAQKAALAGLAVHEAAQQARSASDALAQMASHVVDVRLQKLEHRLALMDDVEALLEAERVALELERRDLYTARCRHWFGGV
jgi:SWI/SNF related-matrix-associated actin-dependent regulator of chromatin subfamily C